MHPKQPIPHKPLIVGGTIAILILGTWAYQNVSFGSIFPAHPDYVAKKSEPRGVLPAEYEEIFRDSDKDDLPDWEEQIYGSDPENADTDADGTADGDELKASRDPKVPNTAGVGEAPTDVIVTIEDPNFSPTTTEMIAERREFFEQYLREQGDKIRLATYQELLKDFDAKKYIPQSKPSSINISQDNGKEALRTYGNAFGQIIRKYRDLPYRTEEAIIEEAVPAKSSSMLQELTFPAVGYQSFAKDLRALSVPSTLGTPHLLIVNGYDGMAVGLRDMQSLFTDPVVGAGGYQGYTTKRIDVITGYADIVNIFHEQGVTFAPSEPGVLFAPVETPQTAP